jgi:hypothetical protein
MTRPLILVATPCYGGQVHQAYMQSVIDLMQYARTSSFDVSLAMLGNDSLITRSRNTLVSAFLDMPQASHLLFIDADISFDPKQVERMLQFDEEVVAGIYPLKVLDWNRFHMASQSGRGEEVALHYCGTPCDTSDAEVRGDFITGLHAGTGFMMIARSAIERMIKAYPELRYSKMHVYPPATANRTYHAVFDCMIEPETGAYLSEDFAFCWRWRHMGGKVWLDTKGRLTHTGVHDFHGNPASRYASMVRQ